MAMLRFICDYEYDTENGLLISKKWSAFKCLLKQLGFIKIIQYYISFITLVLHCNFVIFAKIIISIIIQHMFFGFVIFQVNSNFKIN